MSVVTTGLLLCLCCLQAGLFAAFATGRVDASAFLQVHLGMCAVLAILGCYLSATASIDRAAMLFQLAAWTGLAGPFGCFIAAGLLVRRSSATVSDAGAGPGPDLPRLQLLHGSLLDRRLRLEQVHPVRPLLDVIVEGTQSEKFDALGLIHKRYTPALATTLRRALEDADGSVRVLAATVMAQQHNAHTRRIGVLQESARANADVPQRWRDLGQAQQDYAQSGLLDASRAETELGRARHHLSRAQQLELRPQGAVVE